MNHRARLGGHAGAERPGPLLAVVFAGALLAVGIAPFAVNAAVVDPRVVQLGATGASISYTPRDADLTITYRAPAGWFYRESDVADDRQVFRDPDGEGVVEVRFVVVDGDARAALAAVIGDEANALPLTEVPAAAADGTSAVTRLWHGSGETGAVGVVRIAGSQTALVAQGSGAIDAGTWTVVRDLVAGATVTG